METKLIDFTFDELNWLYLTLEEKRKDYDTKFEIIEKMDPSELKYKLYNDLDALYIRCTQIQTKVDEAQRVVNARDIMATPC